MRKTLVDLKETQFQLVFGCLVRLVDDEDEPVEGYHHGLVGVLDLMRVLVDRKNDLRQQDLNIAHFLLLC